MRTGIMLCYPFEEKRLAKWQAPYIIQPKLDGDRCRACIDSEGKCVLLSSEENIISSVPHINKALEALHLHNVEFDGELYVHGAPHSDIHSIVSRNVNLHPDYSLMEYHIFDIIQEGPMLERYSNLADMEPCIKHPLYLVSTEFVHDVSGIMHFADMMSEQQYEGFVVRDINGLYIRKRSTQLMKFKPRKEDIYEIVGYAEEIDKNGVPKNTLGALVCRGDDGTRFNVGSGSLLTREARINLWQDKENIIGKYAHVKYQHITTVGHVPRFPVVVGIVDSNSLFQ